MSDITTRSGKGLPLTHDEVDANFTNLNTDKYESGDVATFSSATVLNDLAVDNDTLYVDSTNDVVGINEDSNLDAALVVRDGAYTTDQDGGLLIQHGDSPGNHVRAGFKLKSNASGVYRTVIDAASNVGGTLADGHTTETLAIAAASGNIGIPVGNGDGYGITFNSTDHASSTTLDYYEEGVWTPYIATTNATWGLQYATVGIAQGTYTRIGNVVTCQCRVFDVSAAFPIDPSDNVDIENLPFSFKSTVTQSFSVGVWNNITLPTNGVSIGLKGDPNQTTGSFLVSNNTGTSSNLKFSALASNNLIEITFTYLTNT